MTQTVVHVPASEGGGSFDPTDITLTDNTSGAFLVKEGSNEYMRIDTTNGSEQMVLKGNPGGSGTLGNAGLFLVTNPFFQGSENNNIQLNTAGISLQTGNSGNRCDVIAANSGNSFRVLGTGNTERFKVLDDSSATFTLADSSAAVFKVENPAESYDYLNIDEANNRTTIQTGTSSGDYIILKGGGYEVLGIQGNTNVTFTLNPASSANFKINAGSTTYMDVETGSGSEKTTFLVPKTASNDQIVFGSPDHQYLKLGHHSSSPLGASFAFVSQGGTNVNFGYNAHDPGGIEFKTATNRHCDVRLESGASFHIKDPNTNILTVDEDSNATFTLEDGSGAAFKVVNNAGSPKTFLVINDGGNTILDSESSTLFRAQGHTHLTLSGGELLMGASGKYVIFNNGYSILKRSPNLLDLGATTATTVVNLQSNGPYKKIKCTPTTSGQTFTLEFQDGSSTNRDYVTEQDFAIHNAGTENCTIQATITSGRGSALGKDLSAGGSTSGELVTGMTLNAGKSALFKAFKWNKDLAGASPAVTTNEFMFQTIMVEA